MLMEKRDAAMREVYEGDPKETLATVGHQFGLSEGRVGAISRRDKWKRRPRGHERNLARENSIYELINTGFSYGEISKTLNLSRSMVAGVMFRERRRQRKAARRAA